MNNHSQLGKCKGQKYANRVEWNQVMGFTLKHGYEKGRR